MIQKDFPSSSMFSRATTRNIQSLKGGVTYTLGQKKLQDVWIPETPSMPFKTRNIKTNLLDSKGISADFKNNVKITSKPSLVRFS